MIAVVVIAVVTLPLFFLLFGSTKPGMPFGMASIYRSVSDSAAQQYYIARRQGDPIQICVQAGLAAAAFLQAQDEPNYRAWKNKEFVGLRCGRNSPLKGMPANRLGVYRW